MSSFPCRNPEVAWREEPALKGEILQALEQGEDVADLIDVSPRCLSNDSVRLSVVPAMQ